MTGANDFAFEAMQHKGEILAFAALLKEQKIRSYLEIGAKFGGSAWEVGKEMPAGRIVLVDLPNGTKVWRLSEPSLKRCADALRGCGHDVTVIWGDSTDDKVIKQVREMAPFDACLIDANHTRPFLEKDWSNYGSISRIVAFHDIAWKWVEKYKCDFPIHVPQFWDVVKQDYFNVEFKLDPKGNENGIGVLWRY